MVASLRSRQLRSLTRETDLNRSRATPGIEGLLRRKGTLRSAWRRERLGLCPQASSDSNDKDQFSLRDSETQGNLGVVAVLGTAVVVGGALVIFNPYAGQVINQKTIEEVEVPKPLPSAPPSKTKTAPPIAAVPKPSPPPAVPESTSSSTQPAPPSKPAVGVKPSEESGKTNLTLPPPPTPGKTKTATAAERSGDGGSLTPLIGGLLVVAAAGAAVAYTGSQAQEEAPVKAEAEPAAEPAGDSPATETETAAESAGAAEVDESAARVKEAQEWIENWRSKNN